MIVSHITKRAQVSLLLWLLVVVLIASLLPAEWWRVVIASLVGFIVGFIVKKGTWD